jgi:drug/metabolite transporter (DMT)-like permease
MTLASIALVVLASLMHASWNLLAKRAASVGAIFVFAQNLAACVVYAPWVAYLLAHGAIAWSWRAAAFVALSGLIHLGYSLCLQHGYRVADLSVVYPVARGTGPMLSTIGAVVLLGEMPSPPGMAGLALVVAGIVLITTQGNLSAFHRPAGHAGVRWGATTGGLIASYTVADAYTVQGLGIAPVVLDWCSNLMRFFILAPVFFSNPRRALTAMRGYWWTAIAVGVLSSLAYILVLGALRLGAPLTLVAPMREMSMMVGALMGMIVLREPVGPWRLAGCAVLVGGVVLLSLG